MDINADQFIDYPPQVVLQALLATNLTSFTEFAFTVVRPGVPFMPNWHFEAMTHTLSRVASGEAKRVMLCVPPRTAKSLCASVALPAWFLGRNPSERVVVVSYSDLLVRSHANYLSSAAIRFIKRPFRPCGWHATRIARL